MKRREMKRKRRKGKETYGAWLEEMKGNEEEEEEGERGGAMTERGLLEKYWIMK